MFTAIPGIGPAVQDIIIDVIKRRRRSMPRVLKNGKVIIFDTAKIIGEENIEFGDYIIIDDFVFIYAKIK